MRLLIISLLICSGCIQASVSVPSVCDTESISFPAAPSNPGIHLPPVTKTFTLPTGIGTDWLSKVMLISGDLTLDGPSDFSFLDELQVSIVNPKGGDDLVIWDSQKTNASILPVLASDKNLVDYVMDDSLIVNLTISTQQPPQINWKLNVHLCVSAEVDKTYRL